jgi:hypothetical protein
MQKLPIALIFPVLTACGEGAPVEQKKKELADLKKSSKKPMPRLKRWKPSG